jgi:FKBP-type peptidyl-prolyl cis-trans isomerase 2
MAKKKVKIKAGDKVNVHYIGKFPDGEEFDNSYNRGEPIKVEVGGGTLIAGFDAALVGMKVGEKRHVAISKEEAYGDINEDAFVEVAKEGFPNDFPFEKGTFVPLTNEQGQQFIGRLDEVNDEVVRVDLNHPMAGKDLEFDIEVIDIVVNEEA